MLKGHIDSITSQSIEGWAYSRANSLTGKQVLAFDGDVCIGSAEVGVYREDLEAAGLGDGRNGFSINCDPEILKVATDINVRLSDSDFRLVGKSNKPGNSASRFSHLLPFSEQEQRRLAWSAEQGWMSQAQFALAQALNGPGLYIRTFARAELEAKNPRDILEPLIKDTLSMMFRTHTEELRFTCRPLDEYSQARTELAKLSPEYRFVALFSGNIECTVTESAHNQHSPEASIPSKVVRLSPFQSLIGYSDCLDRVSSAEQSGATILHLAAHDAVS